VKILLGVTGSVAATLTPKMVKALSAIGEVAVVCTENSKYFFNPSELGVPVYSDRDEWYDANGEKIWKKKGDPVRHIDLRKEYGVLVVAPLSANTAAKFANGIADNLLTSLFLAWDNVKTRVAAPSMNTLMFENPKTRLNLMSVGQYAIIVPPISKVLACNEEGVGAMALIDDIVARVKTVTRWVFPLEDVCPGIPVGVHPGAFGAQRRRSFHTGVDLYCPEGSVVRAVESGRVVGVERFTGESVGSPWWNETDALLIEGSSGVVCYGEIKVSDDISVGDVVFDGGKVGHVVPVVKEGRERPDVPGHSRSMLHLELYCNGRTSVSSHWGLDSEKHDYMLDPTKMILESENCPPVSFDMPSWPDEIAKVRENVG